MKFLNWIKEKWTDPVWSKVFAGIILAVIIWIVSKGIQLINSIITSEIIQESFSKVNTWISEESTISNFTLLLIFLFIGIVLTTAIYNLITKWWFGRTTKLFASDESYTVRGTYSVDLDLGIQAKGRTDSDFFWQQKTKTERSIVPKNGAQFCVIGQSAKQKLTLKELESLNYSSDEIIANDNHSNRIPEGTLIAYRTKQNRYGFMKIMKYGYNLELDFKTFKIESE